MGKPLKIALLVSGGGSNAQAIIDACHTGRIPVEVTVLGADRPDAGGLSRAAAAGIPTFVVDYKSVIYDTKKNPEGVVPEDFDLEDLMAKQALFGPDADRDRVKAFLQSRAAAESRLLEALAAYSVDLVVLAGFMRTLSPYFIDRVNTDPTLPKIMNIHPALLPSFPGIDGYGDTFRYGCRVGGCTVHFVDYGEDSGPIIGQAAFPILPEDTLEDVKKKGLAEEWRLYPACIGLFAEGRLQVTWGEGKEGQKPRKIVRIQ